MVSKSSKQAFQKIEIKAETEADGENPLNLSYESTEPYLDHSEGKNEELDNYIHPWDIQFKAIKEEAVSRTRRVKEDPEDRDESSDREYYCCVFCSRVFRDCKKYEAHLMSHSRVRPHVCELCSKQFANQINLRQHSRTHAMRPHVCPECGKGFTQKGNLRIHYRVHTGEKPYSCLNCPKKFRQKSILDQHNRTHSGDFGYDA